MATISSSGIGSGLDVNSLITQLMAVEKQPLTVLDQKEASYQAKISAFGNLKSAVSSLQTSALALKSTTLYSGMSATSSSTSVLTASASTAATAASYAIEVTKKAQAQAVASQNFGSLTADIAAADGKLKIELGTFASGTFTPNPDKTPVTISVPQTASSLSEIRDAINAANAGVKATLVTVSSGVYKLSLTSNTIGAANSLRITALDSADVPLAADNTGLAKLNFNPAAAAGSGKEFTVNTEAQDAEFKIDGIALTRSSNTVSDAITGVTLSLASPGTATLNIARNTSAVKTALDSFVKNYNDLNTQLRSLTAYDATSGTASLLSGDSAARNLASAMRDMITYRRSTLAGIPGSLSDLGVSLQRDGSLKLDASKLDAAVTSPTSDLGTLFTSDSTTSPGLAIRMASTLDGLLSTTGLLASRTDGISRSISDIGDQRERLNRRLTGIEKRYRAQFTALDTLVASMQRTSQFLTQQLANLPSTSSS